MKMDQEKPKKIRRLNHSIYIPDQDRIFIKKAIRKLFENDPYARRCSLSGFLVGAAMHYARIILSQADDPKPITPISQGESNATI